MADETPVVKVTLDAIYNEVLATKELLAPLPEKVNDHEGRLRILEAWKNRAAGVGGVMFVLSGVAGALVSHVLK